MIAAVIISLGIMLFAAKSIGNFVEKHPTLKMLALSFLVLIGFLLVIEAFGEHVHWGYWENPPSATISPKDYHRAEELMTRHVVEKAEIIDGEKFIFF